MIGFIDTLYIYTLGLQAIQRYRWSTNFTVHLTHALEFSVHTTRILPTDFNIVPLSLQITHEVSFSQPNSFFAIILQLPIPNTRLNSIPLLPSSYPGRLASRNPTLHCITLTELFFITTLHGPCRKRGLSIVGKACLQCRCIATEVTLLMLACSLLRGCIYLVVS
jgi:hypothetical protein